VVVQWEWSSSGTCCGSSVNRDAIAHRKVVVVRLACEAPRGAAVVHQDCGSSAEGCGSSMGCDSQERDVVVVGSVVIQWRNDCSARILEAGNTLEPEFLNF
jgi:hypothetical protein